MKERRKSARFRVPPGVESTVDGASVRLVDLSAIGARIEHGNRFQGNAATLRVRWQETAIEIPLRVAHSEIVGIDGSRLVYQTGVHFLRCDHVIDGVVTSIISHAQSLDESAAPAALPSQIPPSRTQEAAGDADARNVQFLRDDFDENLPYAQFRRTPSGWRKSYVASPLQPEDGFTISRGAHDFDELQRTFDAADPETRRMMQTALQEQLKISSK